MSSKNINQNKLQFKSLIRLISYMFNSYKSYSIIILICIFINSFATIRGTLFMKNIIDEVLVPLIGQKGIDYNELSAIILKMAGVYGIAVITSLIYSYLTVIVAQNTLKKLRDEVFSHMEQLPIKYFDTNAHGDIMSIYSTDIDTLRNVMTESLTQTISSITLVITTIISMFVLSLPLTIFALLMLSVMLFAVKFISSRSSSNFMEQQNNIGKVNGFVEEMMSGLKVIKVFSHEEESIKDFEKLNNILFKSSYNANKFANILGPVSGNIGNLNFVLTVAIGSFIAIKGINGFTVGSLASFLQFTRSLNQPVNQVSQQLNTFIMASAGASRIFKLLDEPIEKDEGHVELVNANILSDGTIEESLVRTGKWAWKYLDNYGIIKYKLLQGEIIFNNVSFGYNNSKLVLKNINLYAKPGQKIAFVGATGAGKTTITNLINKFYKINSGEILYDGINIYDIKTSDLRRSLGIVLQDTNLFSGSVADNIKYGNLRATRFEIIEAAKLSNAHDFIKYLDKGYDSEIDSESLSQGQRQLLSISRAAVSDPPVLILDEATSSIDTRTEKIVQEGMDNLMEGRTVFVIAHRLSTIKNADVIMVLNQGEIIERGNHDDLIKKRGAYYQLYTGGFED